MKLFLSDFDGTLVGRDILGVVSGINGTADLDKKLHDETMREMIAGIRNHDKLKQRIDLLRGITTAQIKQKLDENNYLNAGAGELFAYLKSQGFKTVLHTGNILPVAEYYQNLLGIDYVVCNRPRMSGDSIAGIEITDFAAADFKTAGCMEIIKKLNVPRENIWAIGDSIVDLGVFKLAGTSVAINAKEGIEKHADIVLKTGDLRELIPYLAG